MASERSVPPRALRLVLALLTLLVLALAAPPAAGQEEGAGDASAAPSGVGTIRGQVFDGKTGEPVEGVSVILQSPGGPAGEEPRKAVTSTGADGAFRFSGVPAGTYDLRFSKAGYQRSTMTSFTVEPGTINRADFPLPPKVPETAEEVLQLDEFVVEASTVEEAMPELQLRMESDQLLNVLSAEDLSRFAASDVAEALERVAGVNIVEGEFAIIRGLEDRYNSTLYNSAVVPSPDPDKQSVQLDLFPSDVVSNLVVSKTFAPDLPSNSSGGAVDIVTHEYPEEGFQLKLKGGSGWNTNASDRFLELEEGSPIGSEHDELGDVLESDYGAVLGGRQELFDREIRFKGVYAREIDFSTKEGEQEDRQPQGPVFGAPMFDPGCFCFVPGDVVESGDLALGELGLTGGRYDLTESTWEKQLTLYGSLGVDLDADGDHRIDGSVFYTRKEGETVQLRENGFLPGFDYADATERQLGGFGLPTGSQAPFTPPFAGVVTVDSFIGGAMRESEDEGPDQGALAFGSFLQSESFQRERDLYVRQLNGEHEFEALPGFRVSWAANLAETTQDDLSRGVQAFFEPPDSVVSAVQSDIDDDGELDLEFPISPEEIGPCEPDDEDCGFFATPGITFSRNSIEETQEFLRIDAEYEADLLDPVTLKVNAGGWYEHAERTVGASFLETPTKEGATNEFSIPGPGICNSDLPGSVPCATESDELGPVIFDPDSGGLDRTPTGELRGLRQTSNESLREIWAWHLGGKLTLWERLDLLAGVRLEDLRIESDNDPFIEDDPSTPFDESQRLGGPRTFPSRFLFFDRLDSPAEGFPGADPGDITFNDEILDIGVPVDESGVVNFGSREALEPFVNGVIDETTYLPSLGVALRPLEGLQLRGAWSETQARPSFRELGYYVTVQPGTDDLTVGNPQLGLSQVESWDLRAEYTWGERGDLVAVSVFQKTIENAIEQIVVRDPTNAEFGSNSALFRTYLNNPNEADLRGIEVEARKNFGFIDWGLRRLGFEPTGIEFLQYLSIGGNYTYIDAEIDRTEAEIDRASDFFGTAPEDTEEFSGLEESRRLFNQPEWIANADLSFDHPDWGTKATLAFFAISDVLDAAGTASVQANGDILSFTPDRYIGSYHELRFTMSQSWSPEALPGTFTLSGTLKNLTDSERAIVFDPQQTSERIEERSYREGRDWSFSLTYELSF